MIRKKGTLTMTLFTKLMLIFLVLGIVAVIWIYTAKIIEMRRIAEQTEKELVLWNTLTGYNAFRSVNAFGDEEFVYDFYKLNRINYTTIDCKELEYLVSMGKITEVPPECVMLYPNKYFYKISFDNIPIELSDASITDYRRYSSKECRDFLERIQVKLPANSAELQECIDGFNAYLELDDGYTEIERAAAEVELMDCVTFSSSTGIPKDEIKKMGYMYDICKNRLYLSDTVLVEYIKSVSSDCVTALGVLKADIDLSFSEKQEVQYCIDAFKEYRDLSDPYTEAELKIAEKDMKWCIIFNPASSVPDSEKDDNMGALHGICEQAKGFSGRKGEGNIEWVWGDPSIPIRFKEIIGIRVDGKMQIGLMEAGVDLVE